MIKAILLDLDDTLLGNSTETFVNHYFKKLGAYAAGWIPSDELMPALLASVNLVITEPDPSLTNIDQFWGEFAPQLGVSRAEAESFFAHFYETEFSVLQEITHYRPQAPTLVEWCRQRGWQIVIATNPIFPQAAIYARLSWAGFPLEKENPFALITTMENSHFAKPHLGYYREILDKIDCRPQETIMIGDDWKNDIAPAHSLGITPFWITVESQPPQPDNVADFGDLAACQQWLQEYAQ